MRTEWYIDAWSVIDGYAFASARPPDSLEAVATFFVSPPYFEPEPVASLATALAATRGHFQEGYRLGGDEVAFDSPEQVVEAVRRGYRAGGLDMNGGPVPRAPQARPRTPDEVDPESLIDRDVEAIWTDLLPWLQRRNFESWKRQNFDSLLANLIEAIFPQLVTKFVGAATFEMVDALTREDVNRSRAALELGSWLERASAVGIDVQLGSELTAFARGTGDGYMWQLPGVLPVSEPLATSLMPLVHRNSGATLSGFEVPFVVPIPFPFQFHASKDVPPIPTLGHLLSVISADPWYLAHIDSPVEFVPIIVAALIQLPPRSLPHQGLPPVAGSQELRDMSNTAARWLSHVLPSDRLRGHPAEKTIHDLVIRLLTRSNTTTRGDEGHMVARV